MNWQRIFERAGGVFLTLLAILAAAVSVYLSVFGRGIWIVPSQYILVAQQWVLGRQMYVDLGYIDPPPLFMYYAAVVMFAEQTGHSLVLSFNFLTTSLVVISGVLFGLTSPRLRIVAGCAWIAAFILMANDANIDREYFFMMVWVPYLMMRSGLGSPPRAAMIVAGALTGFMICMKPHFGFIFVATEVALLLFQRQHLRTLPFIAMIASGFAQVLIFLIFFDVKAYFHDISLWRYYSAIGYSPLEVINALVRSPFVAMSFAAGAFGFLALASTSLIRPFVIAIVACLVSAAVMLILHGQYRYYYVLLFLYPAAGLMITGVLQGPSHFVGINKYLRTALFIVSIPLASLFFWRATASDQGIAQSAYHRNALNIPSIGFGFQEGDPFIAYVDKNIPKGAGIYILNTGYGPLHQDPASSMVRMGRPWPSKYPAGDYDFWFGATIRDMKQATDGAERIRHDLDTGADWFIARSEGHINYNVNIILREFPGFWTWFEKNFEQVDQFDKYYVYRRTTPRNTVRTH